MKKILILSGLFIALLLGAFNCTRPNPAGMAPITPLAPSTKLGGIITNTNIYGVYNETYAGFQIDVDGHFYPWMGWDNDHLTVNASTLNIGAPEGSEYFKCVISDYNYFGMHFALNGTNDMSNFASGTLHCKLKSSDFNFMEIGISGGGTDKHLPVTNYGFVADGAWHDVNIPFSAYTGIDFTKIYNVFWISAGATPPTTDGWIFYFDDVYWKK